jgi:hypothetical protein
MCCVGTHSNGDACAGLGDRMIVGIRSVDVRVAFPAFHPLSQAS